MEQVEEIATLSLNQYPALVAAIKSIRGDEGQEVYFPGLGTKYDGERILRCRRTIEPGYYLVVLADQTMFYVLDDQGVLG